MELTELKPNQKAKVLEILGGLAVTDRLNAMGIRPGVMLTKKNGQFMRGPVVVQVGRGQWALGHGLAKKIMVEVPA